jgi:aminoglycoside 2'-N-acetyltransferase I
MRIEERDGALSREDVAPLFAEVYPPKILETVVWRDVKSAQAALRVIAFDSSNQIVAAAGLLFRDGTVDEEPVRIGGISGVMTAPNMQGKGFGKAVILHAHKILMSDHLVDFGLLFCEPKNIPFYEKLGWRVFAGIVMVEQPSGVGVYTIMTPMARAVHGSVPQSGTINVRGLPW